MAPVLMMIYTIFPLKMTNNNKTVKTLSTQRAHGHQDRSRFGTAQVESPSRQHPSGHDDKAADGEGDCDPSSWRRLLSSRRKASSVPIPPLIHSSISTVAVSFPSALLFSRSLAASTSPKIQLCPSNANTNDAVQSSMDISSI